MSWAEDPQMWKARPLWGDGERPTPLRDVPGDEAREEGGWMGGA